MIGAAANDADLIARFRLDGRVLFEQLRVAADGVERRAQFVAQSDHVTALGEVGGFGDFLGALKLHVGLPMGVDFLHQQRSLPFGFGFSGLATLPRQHEQPCHHADDDREREENFPQHVGQLHLIEPDRGGGLKVNQGERQPDQPRRQHKDTEIVPELRIDPRVDELWKHLAEGFGELRLHPRMRLAQVVAAGVERAAQRADRAGVGRAGGHVFRLERMFTDAALDGFEILPAPFRLACDIIFSAGRPRDHRRGQERHGQRHERRKRFRRCSEEAIERADRHDRRDSHRADADRIDVVEMRALELHVLRAQAEGLVDDEVGDQRADPCDGDIRVKRQRLLQRLVNADLHQQQRDQHVEHQPHHAARMAVRQPREEIRPRD